jgi:hypothetical protein
MALVAIGAGIFHDNLNTYDGGLGVGFGLFLILGAWFLYRHWFGRTGQL